MGTVRLLRAETRRGRGTKALGVEFFPGDGAAGLLLPESMEGVVVVALLLVLSAEEVGDGLEVLVAEGVEDVLLEGLPRQGSLQPAAHLIIIASINLYSSARPHSSSAPPNRRSHLKQTLVVCFTLIRLLFEGRVIQHP